ncbi:MAG: GNAT family N-acetyltransferase, partial [Rhodospirillaceae bacterium]|nr:GNAT family N-acetyltransferase [Rhodospirillaceae bacterium]
AGSRETVRSGGSCPVLPLAGAGEDLRGVVPARKRRKLRMARARARRRGGFAARAVAPAELDAWLSVLFRLHRARWQDRGEAGVLADAAVRRFHHAAAPRLMAAGLLRAWVVTIGGVPAGAYYGLHHRERACAYLGGFDPAFAAESPGTILIGHAIEQALREGAREFDFLRGREPYKYEWGAADRWSLRRSFRRPVADAA